MRDSLFNALDGMEMGKSEHDWLEQRFGSMTAKERLLFQGARTNCVSGRRLGQMLGIGKSQLQKQVNQLRQQGYPIGSDEHGYYYAVNAGEVCAISRKYPINRDILEEIVQSDEKQRYSFSEDGTKIRANQGHSIQVDVELPVTEPPETLYHGTAQRFAASIEAQGLLPQSRLYVHLSPDQETAEKVGRRHGEPVIYLVDAGQMHRDGYLFYLSANGVWLTKVVPATYLKRLEGELKQH